MTPMSPLPPTPQVMAMSLPKNTPVNSLPVMSAVKMAKLLAIQTPTTLALQILGSGKLITPLITEPQPIDSTQKIIQQPIQQTSLNTLLNSPPKTVQNTNPTIEWLKLGMPKVGALLLLLPNSQPTKQQPNDAAPSLYQLLTTNQHTNTLPITLHPNGKVELNLPNSGAASMQLSGNGLVSRDNPSAGELKNTSVSASNILGLMNVNAANKAAPQGKTSPFINPNITHSLAQLSAKLITLVPHIPNAAPATELLKQVQVIQQQLTQLSPSIQNQILPPKLINVLAAMPITPSLDSPVLKEQVAEALEQIISPIKPNALMHQIQALLSISQRIHPNSSPAPGALELLLKGLPRNESEPAVIQNSRAAIAQWMAQEATSHIARLAQLQISQITRHLDHPDQGHAQWDIPLKFGDEYSTVNLRIEEEPEHNQQKQPANQANEDDKKWVVHLTFELPTPHPDSELNADACEQLVVKLHLYKQQISVDFWGDSLQLQSRIEQSLARLKKDLTESGFTVQSLTCQQGVAPTHCSAISQTRVDIKT